MVPALSTACDTLRAERVFASFPFLSKESCRMLSKLLSSRGARAVAGLALCLGLSAPAWAQRALVTAKSPAMLAVWLELALAPAAVRPALAAQLAASASGLPQVGGLLQRWPGLPLT